MVAKKQENGSNSRSVNFAIAKYLEEGAFHMRPFSLFSYDGSVGLSSSHFEHSKMHWFGPFTNIWLIAGSI
jgi:hypothetical protein